MRKMIGAACGLAAVLAMASPALAYTVVPGLGYQAIFGFEDPGDLNGLGPMTGLETHFTCDCTVLTAGVDLNEFDFPPHGGTHVVAATDFDLLVTDPFNISWPALGAFVTGASVVHADFYAYDPDQALNVLVGSLQTAGPNFASAGGDPPNFYLGMGSSGAPGIFTRAHFYSDDLFTLDDVTIGLSDVAPGIPEPSSWLLMLIGFAVLGSALRGRVGARATV